MTKDEDEALKLALEWYDSGDENRREFIKMIMTITAIKEALELAQQEPVVQCLEAIMELADKYATAMERGPFSRLYQGNIQDARANLQAAVEKIVTPPQRKPLTRDQVKAMMVENGYDQASPQERADFINGIRHGEAAHGIKEKT